MLTKFPVTHISYTMITSQYQYFSILDTTCGAMSFSPTMSNEDFQNFLENEGLMDGDFKKLYGTATVIFRNQYNKS